MPSWRGQEKLYLLRQQAIINRKISVFGMNKSEPLQLIVGNKYPASLIFTLCPVVICADFSEANSSGDGQQICIYLIHWKLHPYPEESCRKLSGEFCNSFLNWRRNTQFWVSA
jgi:hypothetical protein